jgi:hypothetical protein
LLTVSSAGCEKLALNLHCVAEIDGDLYVGTAPWIGGYDEVLNIYDGAGNQTWGSDRFSKYSVNPFACLLTVT